MARLAAYCGCQHANWLTPSAVSHSEIPASSDESTKHRGVTTGLLGDALRRGFSAEKTGWQRQDSDKEARSEPPDDPLSRFNYAVRLSPGPRPVPLLCSAVKHLGILHGSMNARSSWSQYAFHSDPSVGLDKLRSDVPCGGQLADNYKLGAG
ncbi:hypothetical protein FKP32DRAFT_1601250 [Trametes sanguinea]|nr:hypothetical protein FKP32DRAFT_1601250 [Trametes sanguinea]